LWRIFYVIIYLQTEMSDSCEVMRAREGDQSSAVQNRRLVVQAEGRSLPAEICEVPA
jgi:hypothetical protein